MAILQAATAFGGGRKRIKTAQAVYHAACLGAIVTMSITILASMLIILPSIAAAQTSGMKVVAKHGDWKVSCGTPVGAAREMCGVSQTVTSEAKPNAGLTLAIFQRVNGQKVMRIRTPLGVLIPYGLLIKIDNTEFGRAPYLLCDLRGCLSEFPLKEAQLKQLTSGKEALFIFWFTPEEGIVFPIQVAGLKPALAKLK